MEFINQSKEFIALLAGIWGLISLVKGFTNARKIRRDELRWKQANVARETVDAIHKHDNARPALTILDWVDMKILDQSEIVVTELNEKKVTITYATILNILPKNFAEASEDDKTIIEQFDWLFYFIDRMEQNIVNKLFEFDDVKYVFLPYFAKITENKKITQTYIDFMEKRFYYLALTFWKRYLNDTELIASVIQNVPEKYIPDASLFRSAIVINSSVTKSPSSL